MFKTATCIAHKRLKDVAIRCVLTVAKASKCVCGQGSAPDPVGGAYSAPPDLLAKFWTGKGLHWEGR